ncbi:MAG TPA: extracellular solute-binding protein, partial [Paenibacillus sp.]|nr:extracellular solute-binding protein [Paenibacillus sp.]
MKNRKPLYLLLTILTTCSMLLAACTGGGATEETPAEETPAVDRPAAETPAPAEEAKTGYDDVIDIDWYVNLSWWKYQGDWGNDKFSQYIKDNFGLNINFITPAGDGADQISAMIATGSVPDLVTVESWLDYKTKLAQGGYLVSMNELIEQYTPDFKPYEDIFGWYKEADGKTYVLPNFAYSRHAMKPGEQLEPNSGFTLRSDIYEQLGRPDISTA